MSQNLAPAVGSQIAIGNQSINVASLFTTITSNPPAYIDVTAFDRNEYPHGNTPQLGYFKANGVSSSDVSLSGNYGVGIIYTYQADSGLYYNSQYGYLGDLNYIASNTLNDSTYLTIVGSNSLSGLSGSKGQDISNLAYNTAYYNDFILGSVDIVTNSTAVSTPIQATPKSIVSTANSFIGQVWNNDGCFVLASNIAARAGSSLPISAYYANGTSSAISNGEWIVVYNGANQTSPTITSAENVLLPGDILTVAWSATGPDQGSGHITTVVSGSGTNAVVMDNILKSGSGGNVVDANDVTLITHALDSTLVYNQAIASSIVVYRLDTPTITVNSPSISMMSGAALKLAALFTTTDAGGAGSLPITEYAIYDTGSGGAQNNTITVNGSSMTAHSSSSAPIISAANLASTLLSTNAGAGGSDTIYVDAFNGRYWGDWVALGVQESASIAVNANQSYVVTTANQSLAGAVGIETAVFNKPLGSFAVNASANTNAWSVVDNTGALGTTSLANITRLQFSNGMVALDVGPSQNAGSVYMLYQAAFNRSPDMSGLGYWINAVDNGANITTTVAQAFVNSPEFIAQYGANPSNASYVNNLYQNVLHRAGDASGVAYWNQELNSGAVTKAYVLEQFATLPEGAADVAATIAHGIAYTQYVG